MFEIIRLLRDIAAAVQNKDYLAVVRLLGDLLHQFAGPQPVGAGEGEPVDGTAAAVELDAAAKELKAAVAQAKKATPKAKARPKKAAAAAAAVGDHDAFDPATVLALIQAALKLLDWWRHR